MTSTTIRINRETHLKLKKMARITGQSSQSILDEALEQYRRRCFLEQANAAFDRMKRRDESWRQELGERKTWDSLLHSGMNRG